MLLGWRLLPVPLPLPPGWGRLRPTPLLLLLLLARLLLLPGWPGGLGHGCCLLLPLPMLLSTRAQPVHHHCSLKALVAREVLPHGHAAGAGVNLQMSISSVRRTSSSPACKTASSGEMHRMLALVDKEAISILPTVHVLCKE
jgi:hypothetical protein